VSQAATELDLVHSGGAHPAVRLRAIRKNYGQVLAADGVERSNQAAL